MYNPVSTIRLQFNKEFTFREFESLIPFFSDLGVKTIYASPIFQSTPGSLHGYDVSNPLEINPEIGTEEELRNISKKLSENGIGWIQDIVPNHMAFHESNKWLWDVLEKGQDSEFAGFFDTPYSSDFYKGKLTSTVVGDAKVNYRRFFTIDGLICINVQDQKVFDKYHELIARLVHDGIFQGLRIDHVDGLYDPEDYFRKLRDLVGSDVYIIIEKILEPGEELDKNWPIQGTTGYEFLATVNNLFTWAGARNAFSDLYRSISPSDTPFNERVFANKQLILSKYMAGELDNLARYFIDLDLTDGEPFFNLKEAIAAFLIHCPYYRYYGKLPLDHRTYLEIEELIDDCRVRFPKYTDAFDQLDYALLEKPRENDKAYNERANKFYHRLMQFTGPLMAKGVEDTLMYNFNRFIAHNEVGDSPSEFGVSVNEFHEAMGRRNNGWNLALNATATHDTKRGEDARMRLNVLTDIPKQWTDKVNFWFHKNKIYQQAGQIDRNDEYFIYQTLIASYPGTHEDDFVSRVEEYMTKAMRESKVHSRWEDPDQSYENAVLQFIRNILDKDSGFMADFRPFFEKVANHGFANSLAQVTLKFTCPGVPDTYQSGLTWDLSMVDPDNRRPVDFKSVNGVKFSLTKKLLSIRSEHKNIFTYGHYRPLRVTGTKSRHVVAFAREYQGNFVVVAAMLHTVQLQDQASLDLTSIDWGNTSIQLPEDCAMIAQDLLDGNKITHAGAIEVSKIFGGLPVAVLMLKAPVTKRSAGILMPVASLPSEFSIGDIGASGRRFADYLFQARQKVWQVLPVNEADRSAGFSPYSALSSMAGSSILIDVKDLVQEGLLDASEVILRTNKGSRIDYEKSIREKLPLIEKAWKNFVHKKPVALTRDFSEFIEREQDWLHGYAQFKVLLHHHNNKPWTDWSIELKRRDEDAMKRVEVDFRDEILKMKWIQFIFFRQMKALRHYCNERGIQLMGDLPFYVDARSCDTWLYRDVFEIDDEGNVGGMAGVPPDYFNDEGQLWGMPVFRWEKNREGVYKWWTERLRKNLEMYDLLRLDHFRAFAEYWRVAPGSNNAVKGEWVCGPGIDFFDHLKGQLDSFSFVAEDLGDVGDNVYELRDRFGMPGMKVLQFGFGAEFPTSVHLPHNYSSNFIAYPGTHDNNTTKGWYNRETSLIERRNLDTYFNSKATPRNVSSLFIRVVYSSHANMAMVAMQDLLDLDERSRMNTPSTSTGNWSWRLKEMPGPELMERLRKMVFMYQR